MTTQRLIIGAGWLAAAVLAVLVGLVAISVIGDGLTGSSGRPLAESEVARQLAAAPEPSSPSSSPSAPPPSASSAPSAPSSDSSTVRTGGGTVTLRCVGGSPEILTMSPGRGYNVHELQRTEGEFRGVTDNHDRVKVRARCDGDMPRITTEERDD